MPLYSQLRDLLEIAKGGGFLYVETSSSDEALEYEVADDDVDKVFEWRPGDSVRVLPSRDKEFPARISNCTRDETAKAIPLGRVAYSAPPFDDSPE